MTATQYSEKRLELLGLLSEARQIKELKEIKVSKPNLLDSAHPLMVSADEELDAISKKLKDNQFQIILVAGFQGGKSTTFNALVGGREISPRGALTATSATVITAENPPADHPELSDKVEVIWRSKKDLLLILPGHVMQFLQEVYPDRQKLEEIGCDVDNLPQLIDLDSESDRAVLQKAIDKEWQYYLDDRIGYDHDALTMLCVARLVLKFYTSDYILGLKGKTGPQFRLTDIPSMVQFPRKWDLRKEALSDITEKEAVFAFVKKAVCYVKSDNLAQMGCRIVDCPGLFNSRYDTQVALDEIERSDAVWFLMGGKGISQSVLRQVKKIYQIKPDNLLFSININESSLKNTLENIIPNNVAQLNSTVFKTPISPDRFFTYHARLALTSIQARKVADDELDEESVEILTALFQRLSDEEFSDTKELLQIQAEDDLERIGTMSPEELEDFDLFSEDGLKRALAESSLEKIVAYLEKTVLQCKAKTILVTEGSQRITKALFEVDSLLLRREQLRRENVEETKRRCDETIQRLKAFQKYCDEQLSTLPLDRLAKILAEEFTRDVLQSAVNESKVQLESYLNADENLLSHVKEKGFVSNLITQIFNDVFDLQKRTWQQSLFNGNSYAVQSFKDDVNDVAERLRDRWSLTMSDMASKYQSSVIRVDSGLNVDVSGVGRFHISTDLQAGFIEEWGEKLTIGASVAGAMLVTGPIGWIIGGVVAALGAKTMKAMESEKRLALIADIMTKVSAGMASAINAQGAKVLVSMRRVAEDIKDGLVQNITASINAKISDNLREQEYRQRQLQLSQKELQAELERSRELREVRIRPIIDKISQLEHSVNAMLRN